MAVLAIFFTAFIYCLVSMPGKSYSGVLPKLSSDEKELSSNLRRHVEYLCSEICPRNFLNPKGLAASADYIDRQFREFGYSPVRTQFKAEEGLLKDYPSAPDNEITYENIAVEIRGSRLPDEIFVIGAHYDSPAAVDGCRAANDNASGVAAVLELAHRFSGKTFDRTVRFVSFPNEEPPFFWTSSMGSYVYAKGCRDRKEKIIGMYSLETIGYYSDKPGSQDYPPPLKYVYPDKGDFVGFVGNISSIGLIRKSASIFRKKVKFPSEGAALLSSIPGVGWSDHWSFWEMGYPALMVTDTAPFRYPYYHSSSDNPDKLDYDSMARVVAGLDLVIQEILNSK